MKLISTIFTALKLIITIVIFIIIIIIIIIIQQFARFIHLNYEYPY